MKKITSLILVVLMVVGMMVPVYAENDTGTVTLNLSYAGEDEILYAGETFYITVSLTGFPDNYISCSFSKLQYDKTCFELVKGTWLSSIIPSDIDCSIQVQNINKTKGTGSVAYGNSEGSEVAIDLNGDVLKLEFKAINMTVAPEDISLEFVVQKTTGNVSVPTTSIIPASVTVLGKDFTNKDTLSLAFVDGGTDTTIEYDDVAHPLKVVGLTEAEATDAKITYTVTDAEGNTVAEPDYKSVGTYNVTAKVAKDGYNDANTSMFRFTITPATLTVTGLKANTKTYDAKDTATIPVEGVADIAGFKGDDKDEVVIELPETITGKFSQVDAGTNLAVTCDTDINEWVTGDVLKNYTFADLTVEGADINKAVVTVTPEYTSKMIGVEADPVIKYTVTGLVGSDSLTGALAREAGTEAKKYSINRGTLAIAEPANKDNYVIELVTVDKTGNEIVFEIVDKVFESIAVTKVPEETPVYVEGTSFDKKSIEVTGYYTDNDGNLQSEVIDSSLITVEPAVFEEVEEDTEVEVTVSLKNADKTLTAETPVVVKVVNKSVKEIKVDAANAKTEYNEAAEYSPNGVVVTLVYDNDTERELVEGEYYFDQPVGMIDENNLLVPSAEPYTIKVKLENNVEDTEKFGTYTITVKEKVLESIAVTKVPNKVGYVVTENFDKTGMEVTATYSNYEPVTVVLDLGDVTITPPDPLAVGKQTVKVSYENKETSFDITVVAKAVKSISVTGAPAKKEYIEGNLFDPAGLKITVTYNDNDTETTGDPDAEISLTDFTYSPSPLTKDTTTVVVSYYGATAEVSGITVNAKKVSSIVLKNKATVEAIQFVDGVKIDKALLEVVAEYDNGSTGKLTDYVLTPETLDLEKATDGKIPVTISYGTVDPVTFTATVVPCEAVIGSVRYASLEKALLAAAEGDTVEVQLDNEITETVEIPANITLDLNGKKVTTADSVSINTGDSTLKVDNSKGGDAVLTINDNEETIAAGEIVEFAVSDDESNDFEIMFSMMRTYHENFVFDIEIEQPKHGTIKGKTIARIGENRTYTFVADEGYVLADVILDGESQGAVEKLVLEKIKDDHTITAVFEKAD